MHKIIPFVLSIAFLLPSCHVYKLKKGTTRTSQKTINQEVPFYTHLLIHDSLNYYKLSEAKVVGPNIVGKRVAVPTEVDAYFKKVAYRRNFIVNKNDRRVYTRPAEQFHLYTRALTQDSAMVSIPINSIHKYEIIRKNHFLSGAGTVLVSAGSFFGSFLLFMVATCGCPHAYVHAGNQMVYANSLFTGANHPKIERIDFKEMLDLNPMSLTYTFELRNEESEDQYIDQLELISVYPKENQQVAFNTNGQLFGYHKMLAPTRVYDENQNEHQATVASSDDNSFDFKVMNDEPYAYLYADFKDISTIKNPKLLLSAKNTKWSGALYKQFVDLFGSSYQDWVKQNTEKKEKSDMIKARLDAGILLQIELFQGSKWIPIDTLDLMGDVRFQEVLIDLPANLRGTPDVSLRLRSGFHFWEIDKMALVETNDEPVETLMHTPVLDSTKVSNDALTTADGIYVTMKEKQTPLSIHFEGLIPMHNRLVFIKAKGHYTSNYSPQGKPDNKQLMLISRKGGLSMFSKKQFEWMQEWKEIWTDKSLSPN
jgi:hypothetical protein